MIDAIKITCIDGFTVKEVILSSTQKKILKDFCLENCNKLYGEFPRRTRYGFYLYNAEFDITVYYILRNRIKGKTIL